jgi:tetratricopeptide (TPR) repeat protein
LIGVGRLEEAADVERELEAVVRKTGADVNRCVLDLYSCLREVIATGDLERLEKRISQSLQESLRLKWGWISLDYVLLGWAQFWRGKWNLAEKNFREAVTILDPKAEGFLGYLISPLLVFLASSGRRDEALDLIDKRKNLLPTVGQPNTLGAWTMLEGTTISWATLDKYDRVADLYPLACEAIATDNIISPTCAGLVQTTAGIAAAAGQRWDLAEKHFETALKQAHELPHVIEQPEVRRWYARMLIERNGPDDGDKACALLSEAVDMYRTIGMPKHLEMTENLLEAL